MEGFKFLYTKSSRNVLEVSMFRIILAFKVLGIICLGVNSHSIFRLFSGCTFVFTRLYPNLTSDVFNYLLLSPSNYYVNFQIVIFPDIKEKYKTLSNTPTDNSLINSVSDYWNAFWKHNKTKSYCTVRIIDIPTKLEISENSDDFLIDFTSPLKPFLQTSFPTSYIVLLLNQPLKHSITKLYLTLPEHLQMTKLFCVDIKTTEIKIGCYTCPKLGITTESNEEQFHTKMSTTLTFVEVKSPQINLKSILSIWKILHRKLNNFGLKSYNELLQIYKTRYSCTNKPLLLKPNGSLNELETEEYCTKLITFQKLNCTSAHCKEIMRTNLFYLGAVSSDKHVLMENSIPISDSAEFDGLGFFIVLGKDESGQRFKMAIQNFLLPLPYTIWLGILLSFLSFLILLRLSGVLINKSVLWLYSVALDQGDNMTKSRNSLNWYLIIIWLLMMLVLKNAYNCKMYSHLTKSPEPQNIPKTFHSLFFELGINDLNILVDRVSYANIAHHMRIFRDSKSITSNVHKHIRKRLKIVTTHYREISLIQNITKYGKISYNKLSDNSTGPFAQISSAKRFAMIYDIIGFRRMTSARFLKPLISHFGKRHIVDNSNDHIMLATPKLWFVQKEIFFLEQLKQTIWQLTESGIFKMLRKNCDLAIQVNAIKGIVASGKFKDSFVNAYAYSSLVLDGNAAELDNNVEMIKFENIRAVFILFYILCTAAFLILILELILIHCIYEGRY